MNESELLALLSDLESDRVERKASLANPNRIREAICAFANDSPGGTFGQVTRENFGHPGITDYRNPYLAEAMKVLGYVQRFGVGIPIARQELKKNGNPPPEFGIEPTNILVTVRKREEQ